MQQTSKKYSKNSGFSLVELAIVVVMIGVLSAVAVPVYKKNVEKARRTEAMASIGTIKTQLLIAYGVDGRMPISPSYTAVVGRSWNDIQPGELTGVYFRDEHYEYQSSNGIQYMIKCKKINVLEESIWLNELGEWKHEE